MSALLDLIYPPRCLVCGEVPPRSGDPFCATCADGIFNDRDLCCPHCAATVGPHSIIEGKCARCRDESFAFDQTFRLGEYTGVRRQLALWLKHSGHETLAERIGQSWAELLKPHLATIDAIIPVPLHWMRRLSRGYNQSQALARGLARNLGVPLRSWWLWRVRRTPSQQGLSRTARKDNVKGAFGVTQGICLGGMRLLLVDDVMTTGATAAEAAKALKVAGALHVTLAVVARVHE